MFMVCDYDGTFSNYTGAKPAAINVEVLFSKWVCAFFDLVHDDSDTNIPPSAWKSYGDQQTIKINNFNEYQMSYLII